MNFCFYEESIRETFMANKFKLFEQFMCIGVKEFNNGSIIPYPIC